MISEDLEALKEYIKEEHQKKNLNMRKTAIISADMTAPIAAIFTYFDWKKLPYNDGPTLQTSTPRGQDVRALVFISPNESVPGLKINKAIKALKDPAKNMAILTLVGTRDNEDDEAAENIYTKLDGKKGDRNEGRFQLLKHSTKYRGYNLINNHDKVAEQIYAFLEIYLKPINDPWRDRQSRYNK